MNGPSHYREAERAIASGLAAPTRDETMADFALAQVHATLALTAATAFNSIGFPGDGENAQAWVEAVMT